MKNIKIFIRKLSFFGGKIFSVYLNRRVFVMKTYKDVAKIDFFKL